MTYPDAYPKEWFDDAKVTGHPDHVIYRNGKSIVHRFASIYDALDEVINLDETADGSYRSSLKDGPFAYEDTHTNNFGEAADVIRNGWTEHMPQVNEFVSQIRTDERVVTMVDNSRFKQMYSCTGALVSVPLYCAGSYSPMVTHVPIMANKPNRVARVLIGGGMLGSVEADSYVERGILIVALCKVLDAMGWQIDLWTEATVQSKDNEDMVHSTLYHVHEAGQSFDAESVMFQLAHPSMHRRLTFGIRESGTYQEVQRFGSNNGYGRTRNPICSELIGAHLVIDAITPFDRTITDPAKWILDKVHSLTD